MDEAFTVPRTANDDIATIEVSIPSVAPLSLVLIAGMLGRTELDDRGHP